MNNNITPDMLIQYLDNEVTPKERLQVEDQLSADPSLRQQLDRLQLAKQAVGQYARKQELAGLHARIMHERRQQTRPLAKVHLMRLTMRIAAILLVLVLIGGIVQYSLLNTDRLYNDKYDAFSLGVSRSTDTVPPLEQAYRNGNMKEVIRLYETDSTRRFGEYFLAGQAYLAINNVPAAIQAFEAQLDMNNLFQSQFKYYEEDAEYYLALAYLKAENVAKAISLFESIHSQPEHAYHKQVSRWYLMKLRWLKRKQS